MGERTGTKKGSLRLDFHERRLEDFFFFFLINSSLFIHLFLPFFCSIFNFSLCSNKERALDRSRIVIFSYKEYTCIQARIQTTHRHVYTHLSLYQSLSLSLSFSFPPLSLSLSLSYFLFLFHTQSTYLTLIYLSIYLSIYYIRYQWTLISILHKYVGHYCKWGGTSCGYLLPATGKYCI